MARRWRFLFAVVASVFAFAGTAQATPVFLSAINISDAGQDAFEPQIAIDGSGVVHAVWTRSDGTNFRIQYSTRTAGGNWSSPITLSDPGQGASQPQVEVAPSGDVLVLWTRSDGTNLRVQAVYKAAGGSFGTPVNVSGAGFDATDPDADFDNAGKALVVWSRFDGSKIRVQGSTRSAGVGGVFGASVTLSESGQDAIAPKAAAGPDVDANGAAVWYRSDGTKLRVQSARRRDYVGYPRPRNANAVRSALVVAYNQCLVGSANRTHGPGLAFPSCNPPVKTSGQLTVGTPDANGFSANSVPSVRWKVIPGVAATEANEADVQAIVKIDDVRNQVGGTDYTGMLGIRVDLKMTDQRNAAEQPEAGTSQTLPLEVPAQCSATGSTSIGGNCTVTVSLNALLPGAVQELKRSVWELGQTTVRDAGPNGTGYAACPPTCGDGDEQTFMRQGIFVP